jgi:hypothetical protein
MAPIFYYDMLRPCWKNNFQRKEATGFFYFVSFVTFRFVAWLQTSIQISTILNVDVIFKLFTRLCRNWQIILDYMFRLIKTILKSGTSYYVSLFRHFRINSERRLLDFSCPSSCSHISAWLPLHGFSWKLVLGTFNENPSRSAKFG